jgi:hypothetical protein
MELRESGLSEPSAKIPKPIWCTIRSRLIASRFAEYVCQLSSSQAGGSLASVFSEILQPCLVSNLGRMCRKMCIVRSLSTLVKSFKVIMV